MRYQSICNRYGSKILLSGIFAPAAGVYAALSTGSIAVANQTTLAITMASGGIAAFLASVSEDIAYNYAWKKHYDRDHGATLVQRVGFSVYSLAVSSIFATAVATGGITGTTLDTKTDEAYGMHNIPITSPPSQAMANKTEPFYHIAKAVAFPYGPAQTKD